MINKLFKCSTPLPYIPENATKNSVITAIKEYAAKNSFETVIARSTATSAHLKCKKGGERKNFRKLTEEERKSWRNSCRAQCPFYIRIGKKKGGGFAIKFRHLKTMYPLVHHLYFEVDKSYATLFKTTWNLFGQFPKYKESLPFNPETDKLITVSSSDEE